MAWLPRISVLFRTWLTAAFELCCSVIALGNQRLGPVGGERDQRPLQGESRQTSGAEVIAFRTIPMSEPAGTLETRD